MFWTWLCGKKLDKVAEADLPLTEVPFRWQSQGGFSHPQWSSIHPWVFCSYPPAQQPGVYRALTTAWLERVCHEGGAGFGLADSRHFRLLSPFSPTKSKMFLQFFEEARRRIDGLLGDLAFRDALGPHVVMIFRNSQQYWKYASHFFGDGEVGGQGGVCVQEGYVHVVSYDQMAQSLQGILAHEFVHNLLVHRKMPLWLEEGLAELLPMQMRLSAGHLGDIASEAGALRQCWQKHGLTDFWSGESFFAADERQKASYQLSEVLTRLILDGPNASRFGEFVAAAERTDGGERAALSVLGYSLNDAVSKFLGPGRWLGADRA
ncbi:hypothetical protein IV102_18245 [bacterium]|nr:hypothetical protein [bacterium]